MTSDDTLFAWLTARGLEQYADVLEENDVDLPTLKELSEDDLKELGVSLGHRKTILKAVAEPQADDAQTTTERRQLSVLFCDLVGSTVLANSYDTEDLALILQRYHTAANAVIRRWGGLPLGTQGDGVVACFGYPKAQENNAERAVRAAQAIVDAVTALTFDDGLNLHCRVAAATGRVVVGDIVDNISAIAGSVLNLASRLQDCAAPDTVVVGAETRVLIDEVADLTSLGQQSLKGFEDTQEVWRVNTLREAGDRFRSLNRDARAALVGRTEELDQLTRMWARTRAGQGGVAVVSGAAGIGKSHLVEAFIDHARAEEHLRLRYFCSPFYQNSAFHPVIAQIRRVADLDTAPSNAARLDRLARLFAHEPDRHAPVIAQLLSIPLDERYIAPDLTQMQRKSAVVAALSTQLQTDMARAPVLVVVEDVNWCDPTSFELMDHVARNIAPTAPVMMVVTQRNGDDAPWADAGALHMRLSPLDQTDSETLIRKTLTEQTAPIEVIRAIIDKSDGVPLFLEELSRTAALRREAAGAAVALNDVPATLEDSLMAQLDALPAGRTLAQQAAVLGRWFDRGLLSEISGLTPQAFEHGMFELREAGVIVQSDSPDNDMIGFRHALLQQTAYGALLRRDRRRIHEQVALILSARQGVAENEPETLARHFAGAGMPSEAVEHLLLAGKRASARAAQLEAVNHFNAALEQAAALPDGRARTGLEAMIQALRGGALMAVRGFAADEVMEAFRVSRDLCRALGDSPVYASALYGLLTVTASRSHRGETLALADEMLSAFRDGPVVSWDIAARFAAGYTYFFQGRLAEAQALFEQAADLYSPDQHDLLIEQFGEDLGQFALCYLQWIHLLNGDLVRSRATLERAQAIADDQGNPASQIRMLGYRMGHLNEVGDVAAGAAVAQQLIDQSTERGYPYWTCAGQIGIGWAKALSGDTAEGLAMIRAALSFYDMIGQKTPQTFWRLSLIGALVQSGDRDGAIAEADAMLAQCREGLDCFYEAMLLTVKAQALMADPPDYAAGEQALRDAVASATRMEIPLHRLISAQGLAQLLAATGRAGEAAEILSAAIRTLPPDGGLPALDVARQQLAALG